MMGFGEIKAPLWLKMLEKPRLRGVYCADNARFLSGVGF
jgi:hypothetical protein